MIRHQPARALVVYESMFGNTEAVARAIAGGLSDDGLDVRVVHAADAPSGLDDVDLLVVGGPTHAFSMTRASTRRSAADQGATAADRAGVREFLDRMEIPEVAPIGAAFDTRLRRPPMPGAAARAIRRRLRRRGVDVVGLLRSDVTATAGPLAEGELERARRFGADLAGRVDRSVGAGV